MEILFSDRDIVCAIKPIGVLSEDADAASSASSMVSLLREQTGKRDVFPVHRLDQSVGGVMVYALTRPAAAALSAMMAASDGARSFEKTYLCVVSGITEPSGTLNDLLFKDSRRNKSFVVDRMRRGVKEASLSFVRLAVGQAGDRDVSLLRVTLHTGRSHQIRVQLSHAGHPIMGDGKYGAPDSNCPIALFSHRLAFLHPVTKVPVTVSALPPDVYPWNVFSSDPMAEQ